MWAAASSLAHVTKSAIRVTVAVWHGTLILRAERPSSVPKRHCGIDHDDHTVEVSESIWPADRIMIFDDYDVDQQPAEDTEASDV